MIVSSKTTLGKPIKQLSHRANEIVTPDDDFGSYGVLPEEDFFEYGQEDLTSDRRVPVLITFPDQVKSTCRKDTACPHIPNDERLELPLVNGFSTYVEPKNLPYLAEFFPAGTSLTLNSKVKYPEIPQLMTDTDMIPQSGEGRVERLPNIEKVWDEENKQFYYVNKKTGDVNWEKPKVLKNDDVDPTPRSRALAEAAGVDVPPPHRKTPRVLAKDLTPDQAASMLQGMWRARKARKHRGESLGVHL